MNKKEEAISNITIVKRCLENLKEYEKWLEDLELAHLRGNQEAVLDILRGLDLTPLVDNKHVPLVGALHAKFCTLLGSIQDGILRSSNIRQDFAAIDRALTILSQVGRLRLLPLAVGRYWSLCVGQANSVIAKGDIGSGGLTFSKEDDLIHLLKRDPYEKFVNSHALLNSEDVSKSCSKYLGAVAEAFAGLALSSRVFGSLETAKKEFATAAKELVIALIDKLDSMTDFVDYRLVNHDQLSSSLGRLLSVLKRVYFDGNPEEENKILKEKLYQLLGEYYRHLLRNLASQSNFSLIKLIRVSGALFYPASIVSTETLCLKNQF